MQSESMLVLDIELLAGRYHATPWDQHANEAAVEWPPSPWRLGRALASSAYRLEVADDPQVRDLVMRLASTLPIYQVPPASLGHTRHYMPDAKSTNKVFDGFALVSTADKREAHLLVGWPGVALSDEQRALLERLVAEIGYLGRAESWAHVTVSDVAFVGNVHSLGRDEEGEYVVETWLLAGEAGFEGWLDGFLAAGGKKKAAPAGRWDALTVESGALHKAKRRVPPGVRRARYAFATRPFVQHAAPRPVRRHRVDPTIARLAIHGRVLPPLAHALAIGDRMRSAAMSWSSEDQLTNNFFAGRDDEGGRLEGNRHPWFLPMDDSRMALSSGPHRDACIDHVLVWCPTGLPPGAVRALESIQSLWGASASGDGGRYGVSLVGLGRAEDYGTSDGQPLVQAARDGLSPSLACARVWVSHTPFVMFRHPKRRGDGWKDGPEDQVRLALSQLGLPMPVSVEAYPIVDADHVRAWRGFYRQRKQGGGSRGSSKGHGFRLVFDEPVRGPIALGYGAHFGLGQFVAIDL